MDTQIIDTDDCKTNPFGSVPWIELNGVRYQASNATYHYELMPRIPVPIQGHIKAGATFPNGLDVVYHDQIAQLYGEQYGH